MIHSTIEYLFFAENNQIDPAEYRFVPARFFSPYMECVPATLNKISLDGAAVDVNPFYRYEKIFAKLLNSDDAEQYQEIKNFVFDFWIREVYRYERLQGMTRHAFERGELIKEILSGMAGDKVKDAFTALRPEERGCVADCLLRLREGGDAIHLFTKAARKLIPDSSIYVLDQKEILVYAGEKESYLAKRKLQSLQFLFLPIGAKMDVFWEKHFGVWGIDETMKMDEVVMI